MKIFIVIPTLNEAGCISRTLTYTKALPGDFELLVVEGSSTDQTMQIAERHGVALVRAPGGRAVQMNYGASRAHGDVLLFLHADTRLPQDKE